MVFETTIIPIRTAYRARRLPPAAQPPKPLLNEMVGEVLQPRLECSAVTKTKPSAARIFFAGSSRAAGASPLGIPCTSDRASASLIALVSISSTSRRRRRTRTRIARAECPIGTIRPVDDEDAVAHADPPLTLSGAGLFRQFMTGLLGHHVFGVPGRPVRIMPTDPLFMLAMRCRGATKRTGKFSR